MTKESRKVSIRSRIAWVVVLIFTVFLCITLLLDYAVILPVFRKLEHERLKADLERVENAIFREVELLDQFCFDWAAWDDTYEFVEDLNQDYITANFHESTFEANRINIMAVVNTEGNVVWGKEYSLEPLEENPEHFARLIQTEVWDKFLITDTDISKKPLLKNVFKAGIAELEGQVLMFSARPIIRTGNEGPFKGTFIMGRFFNQTVQEELNAQLKLNIFYDDGSRIKQTIQDNNGEPIKLEECLIITNEDSIDAFMELKSFEGERVMTLHLADKPYIILLGITAMKKVNEIFFCTCLVVVLVLMLLLNRFIVKPIQGLIKHMDIIANDNEPASQIDIKRNDEIGDLSVRFNSLMKLVALRKQDLETRAQEDGLTGLYNRRSIMDFLEKEVAKSNRYSTPLSVIMMDVDHFKKINDTYGHLTGDMALVIISSAIKGNLRDYDYVGRYGGEEFILVLPNQDTFGAKIVGERVRELVASLGWDPQEMIVTVSGGISTLKEGQSAADLVQKADEKLYQAKTQGRNRVLY